MEADAVVRARRELEFEIEDVVRESVVGHQIATLRGASDGTVLDHVTLAVPAGEVLAIEQRTGLEVRFRVLREHGRHEGEQGKKAFHEVNQSSMVFPVRKLSSAAATMRIEATASFI